MYIKYKSANYIELVANNEKIVTNNNNNIIDSSFYGCVQNHILKLSYVSNDCRKRTTTLNKNWY